MDYAPNLFTLFKNFLNLFVAQTMNQQTSGNQFISLFYFDYSGVTNNRYYYYPLEHNTVRRIFVKIRKFCFLIFKISKLWLQTIFT